MSQKGLYKRGKVWWICYVLPDGRMVRESARTMKQREALALLIKRKQAVVEGMETETKRIASHSFYELAEDYLKWAKRQRGFRSKKTFVSHLVNYFGKTQLSRFNTKLVEQFQTAMINAAYKPATVNRFLATLKHMFSKATDWEMVNDGVLKKVRKVKLLEENNKRLRFLSKEECQALINACDTHLMPIVIVALNTGMRKMEVLLLKWETVDLRHGFILLAVTKNGERREIPINDTVRETLQSLTRRLDVPYVFYDPRTGKPYQDVKRSFASACKRAGIRDFHFHDLRHTFASHLIMTGTDLTTVRELLGHSNITMTLRYAHLAPSHKVKAVKLLDSTLNENSTSQLLHNSKNPSTKKAPSR